MASKILRLCCLVAIFWSCSKDDEPAGLNDYDRRVIEYFGEVALGFEFGGAMEVTRKWSGEMRVFVGGEKKAELMAELQDIVTEINELATDGFRISIVQDSTQMNYYVFLGSGADFAAIYPSQAALVDDNWGLFNVYWDLNQYIDRGNMYVDIDRANETEEKHLLREELTQSLGLAKDSKRYNDSIFQDDWTTTTDYSAIDMELIRLLYHPEMVANLSPQEAETRLIQIILSEK